MRWGDCTAAAAAGALLFAGGAASAQTAAVSGGAGVALADSASPFGVASLTADEVAAVPRPSIAFTATGAEAKDFDKYYVFHRPATDLATAYADLVECDGYARGLQSEIPYEKGAIPVYGFDGGIIGATIGSAMADAVHGSAARRRLRRVNMRACMHFKGYDRYGLPKETWERFNFEEGLRSISEERRKIFLIQQAMVSSGAVPQGEALGQ